MYTNTPVVVLSSIKYRDTSLIVRTLAPTGIISFIIKGVLSSKKSALRTAHFQPLNILDVIATTHRPLNYIKEAKIINPHQNIRADPHKQSIVFFVCELLHTILQEANPQRDLFDFICKSIQWLDQSESISNFHLVFLVQLSKYLGFYPNTLHIENGNYFDLTEGVFCDSLPMRGSLNSEETQHFKMLLSTDYDNLHLLHLNREQRNQLLDGLIKYYQHHLDNFKKIQSVDILRIIL